MLVILSVSQGSKETGLFADIAIGATVLLEAMFAEPICGASMNPVRSLAPAVVSGNFRDVWIYIFAPIMGAILAIFAWKLLKLSQKVFTVFFWTPNNLTNQDISKPSVLPIHRSIERRSNRE